MRGAVEQSAPAGKEIAGRVFERVLHHAAAALDGVELVVVDVESGDLPHRDRSFGHRHAGIEQRGEGHVRPRVVKLNGLDGVHQRAVLKAPQGAVEGLLALGYGGAQVAFGQFVVGAGQAQNHRIGRGVRGDRDGAACLSTIQPPPGRVPG